MVTQTRQYTDFDAAFLPNPVTGDISIKKNEQAIAFALKSLVLTRNYERPFQSSIGSQAYRLLFEPMDDVTKITLRQAIITSIANHEPRVDILDIIVDFYPDQNIGNIIIVYLIKSTKIVQSLTVALTRTR